MAEQRAHAILSASGSERWLNCPPSARAEEKEPDNKSDAGEEGTLGHELVRLYLRAWLDNGELMQPVDFERDTLRAHRLYSKGLEDAALECVEYAKARYLKAKALDQSAHLYVERRVDFSRWVQEGFGTVDVAIVYNKTLEPIDWKFGEGVVVSAVDNSQTRLYALGIYVDVCEYWDIERVITTIFQPRLDRDSSETLTIKDLLDWADNVVLPTAALAWLGQGEFKAGEWCRFCRIRATCKARADMVFEEAAAIFAQPQPAITTISLEELAAQLPKFKLARQWINDAEAYLFKQALSGVSIPGNKLVEGRSVRKYSDQQKVAEALIKAGIAGPLLWERKLLGITDMQKAVGKKLMTSLAEAGLVTKPPGKPALVPETDPRPAIDSTADAVRVFTQTPLSEETE